ncbi:hypothetical protein [Nonomuraea sp. NPDC049646]|uniref:hypothetical protein n=1 Tax=unclassified Nonomuraea TaxID=2593643 RepID=UPI0037873D07
MTLPEDWPGQEGPEGVELGYEHADEEPDYFARVAYFVLDFPGLSRRAKDAYICLVRGLEWGMRRRKEQVKRQELAAVMSISTDTFDRGVKELEEKGIVRVNRQRDPATGNWLVSSYWLKDTKGARMRARILELEHALGKADGSEEQSPQVEAGPQNAARTEEDKPGGEVGAQSADCGVAATSEDAAAPQVGTSPQNAEPPVRTLRTRRSADCGHTREGFLEKEKKREESQDQNPQVPAVGGPADRNARACEAPSAQPDRKKSIRGRAILAQLRRYRLAPGWVRTRHLVPMTVQALEHFGADAIIRYAVMVAAEDRYAEHQHIPEYREVLRRLGHDVMLGTVCAEDGLDPAACPCDAPLFPPADRPWTDADQQDWERVLETFVRLEQMYADDDAREGEP